MSRVYFWTKSSRSREASKDPNQVWFSYDSRTESGRFKSDRKWSSTDSSYWLESHSENSSRCCRPKAGIQSNLQVFDLLVNVLGALEKSKTQREHARAIPVKTLLKTRRFLHEFDDEVDNTILHHLLACRMKWLSQCTIKTKHEKFTSWLPQNLLRGSSLTRQLLLGGCSWTLLCSVV